jgi:hypothetical protein
MGRLLLYVRTNLVLILLALALSWLVWVQLSTFFVETWRGEVPLRRLVEDQVLVLESGREEIVVEVRGNRREIDQLRAGLTADIRLRNEFLDPQQASQSRTFTVEDLELPGELEALRMEPEDFEIRFTKRARVQVSVVATRKAHLDTSRIEGFEVLDPLVVQNKVLVEGPEKILSELKTIELQTIDLSEHVDRMRGKSEIIVRRAPLDVEALREQGVRIEPREVDVLVRFKELHKQTVRVPLEAHWVDPDPEKPRGFVLKSTGSIRDVVEQRGDRLMVKITLVGPREAIAKLLEGSSTEDGIPTIDTVRAYVRSDDAFRAFVDSPGAIGPVRFERLPEGVVPERVDPLPDGDEVEPK